MVRHTIFVFHSAGFGQLVRNSAISRAWKATLPAAPLLCAALQRGLAKHRLPGSQNLVRGPLLSGAKKGRGLCRWPLPGSTV